LVLKFAATIIDEAPTGDNSLVEELFRINADLADTQQGNQIPVAHGELNSSARHSRRIEFLGSAQVLTIHWPFPSFDL
jgi:hypothetical protein